MRTTGAKDMGCAALKSRLAQGGKIRVPESIGLNLDCMEYMRTLPDNAFDIAVVDPPYGAGFTEGGGCKGWFAKYHQDSSQSLNVERERERAKPTAV